MSSITVACDLRHLGRYYSTVPQLCLAVYQVYSPRCNAPHQVGEVELRCLILSCSDRKTATSDPLPALERYDGPAFRVVRRYLREHPKALGPSLQIAIVSAEYGLVWPETKLPPYDRRMILARAQTLQQDVVPALRAWLTTYAEIDLFMMLGRSYQPAVEPTTDWLPRHANLTVSNGGWGKQQHQLAAWLDQRPFPMDDSSSSLPALPPVPLGQAVLRGVTINATPEEIEMMVRECLTKGDESHIRSRKWLAQVGPYQVAPKWLVSRLSGVPVSGFATDDARRVLTRLGIPVILR